MTDDKPKDMADLLADVTRSLPFDDVRIEFPPVQIRPMVTWKEFDDMRQRVADIHATMGAAVDCAEAHGAEIAGLRSALLVTTKQLAELTKQLAELTQLFNASLAREALQDALIQDLRQWLTSSQVVKDYSR